MSINFKEIPIHPESNTRMMLGGTDAIKDIDVNECRILRDYANRALLEIIRIRKRHPFLDDKINLYTEKSNPSIKHTTKVTLSELHTLLDELDAILDHAYEHKKMSEKKSTNLPKIKQQGIGQRRHCRRRYQSNPDPQHLPTVHTRQVGFHHLPKPKVKPEVTLIRRTQLHESEI